MNERLSWGASPDIPQRVQSDLNPISAEPNRTIVATSETTAAESTPPLSETTKPREWLFRNDGPMDSGSWGVDEHRQVLRQLAKLKFNRVSINVRASQPFVHFEFRGVKRRTEQLWGPTTFPVSGDTLGRKVFGGAKVFENPSFVDAATYEERIAAGTKHLTGIINDNFN